LDNTIVAKLNIRRYNW